MSRFMFISVFSPCHHQQVDNDSPSLPAERSGPASCSPWLGCSSHSCLFCTSTDRSQGPSCWDPQCFPLHNSFLCVCIGHAGLLNITRASGLKINSPAAAGTRPLAAGVLLMRGSIWDYPGPQEFVASLHTVTIGRVKTCKTYFDFIGACLYFKCLQQLLWQKPNTVGREDMLQHLMT